MITSKAFLQTSYAQFIIVIAEIIKLFILGRYLESNDYGLYFLIITSSFFITEFIKGYAQISYINQYSDWIQIQDTLTKVVLIASVLASFICLLTKVSVLFIIYVPCIIVLYGLGGIFEMNMIRKREFKRLSKLRIVGAIIQTIPIMMLLYADNGKIHLILISSLLFIVPITLNNFKNNSLELTWNFKFDRDGITRGFNIFFLLLNNNLEKYLIQTLSGNAVLGEYTMSQNLGRKLEQKLNPIANTTIIPLMQDKINANPKYKTISDKIAILSIYFLGTLLFVITLPYVTEFFFQDRWGEIKILSLLFALLGYLYAYETILKNKILLHKRGIGHLLKFDIISFLVLVIGLIILVQTSKNQITGEDLVQFMLIYKVVTNFYISVIDFKGKNELWKYKVYFYLIHCLLSIILLTFIIKPW